MKRPTFEEFAHSRRPHWGRADVVEPGIKIYVRRSAMLVHAADFELASLNATVPGGKALTRFLDKYEPRFSFLVENIHEPRLVPFLLKRGYRIIGGEASPLDTSMIFGDTWHFRDRDVADRPPQVRVPRTPIPFV
jgi:hypothetical protein